MYEEPPSFQHQTSGDTNRNQSHVSLNIYLKHFNVLNTDQVTAAINIGRSCVQLFYVSLQNLFTCARRLVTNSTYFIDKKLVTFCRKWLLYQFLFCFYIFDSRTLLRQARYYYRKNYRPICYSNVVEKNLYSSRKYYFQRPFFLPLSFAISRLSKLNACDSSLRMEFTKSRQVQCSTCYVKLYTTILAEGMFPHNPLHQFLSYPLSFQSYHRLVWILHPRSTLSFPSPCRNDSAYLKAPQEHK